MKTPILLRQQNLKLIGKRIPVPTYDREAKVKGIVHIGVGGFHRAHQAYYMQQLRKLGDSDQWGICGIGLRDEDQKLYDILRKQDHLYTLLVKYPDGNIVPEVIGSIIDFEFGLSDSESVIARMAHASTKIVSLTITEGGYNFNSTTGEFNFDIADIQHELQHPNDPKTVYGFLTAALKRRRDAGLKAFTILSCDNIEHNGDMTRRMLLAFADEQDANLAEWIAHEVCFPNCMVDRITPVTVAKDIEILAQSYGIQDAWPVTCEPFIQWVVEDKFSNGRPDFEKVGVQFVSDVAPYEKMKLRLLNAGHSVLGILGALHGHTTINACMEDNLFKIYLRSFLDKEATQVLGDVEGIDLEDYKNSILQRFANPNIKDGVSRICSENSAKLPKFLIPTIHENLATGGSIKFATLILVAWCYYSDKEVDQSGQALEIIDARRSELHQAAQETRSDPLAFIKIESLFGNLATNNNFTEVFIPMLQEMYKVGNVKELMQKIISFPESK